MKHIAKLSLCVLVCLMLSISLADAPENNGLSESVVVQVYTAGQYHELPQFLLCAHENSRMSDGVLAVLPLDVFLMQADIPIFSLTDDFSWGITDNGGPETLACHYALLQYTPAGLVALDPVASPDNTMICGILSSATLPDGTYLLRIDFRAGRGEEYYAGAAFAWLCVGDATPLVPWPSSAVPAPSTP